MSQWLVVLAVVIIAALFLVYQANKEPTFNPAPPKVRPPPISLSYQELRKYDGVNDPSVYVALKGVIYDVSSSDFYGVGGGYHQFAGHDASINLAKMSHDDQFLDKYGEITLDKEESTVLNDWVLRFETKYMKVGNVVNPAKPQ